MGGYARLHRPDVRRRRWAGGAMQYLKATTNIAGGSITSSQMTVAEKCRGTSLHITHLVHGIAMGGGKVFLGDEAAVQRRVPLLATAALCGAGGRRRRRRGRIGPGARHERRRRCSCWGAGEWDGIS